MAPLQTTVDGYLTDGCGRCAHFATPRCKARRWAPVLRRLRAVALECGLAETVKWGAPCYVVGGKNVAMVSALVDRCVVSFFKGSLLEDPDGVLEPVGPNSRVARQLSYTSEAAVDAGRAALSGFLRQAMALEAAGARVAPRPPSTEPLPDELVQAFAVHPGLEAAFAALTPGRQRGYLLHFREARQSATRTRRVAQCVPAILAGQGRQD